MGDTLSPASSREYHAEPRRHAPAFTTQGRAAIARRMPAKLLKSCLDLATNSLALGAEASMVVPLRLARLAAGGQPAASEAERMVTEKVEALTTLHLAWQTGSLGKGPVELADGTVKHYLGYVRANRKRLMGGG